jgi:hypothetical protein
MHSVVFGGDHRSPWGVQHPVDSDTHLRAQLGQVSRTSLLIIVPVAQRRPQLWRVGNNQQGRRKGWCSTTWTTGYRRGVSCRGSELQVCATAGSAIRPARGSTPVEPSSIQKQGRGTGTLANCSTAAAIPREECVSTPPAVSGTKYVCAFERTQTHGHRQHLRTIVHRRGRSVPAASVAAAHREPHSELHVLARQRADGSLCCAAEGHVRRKQHRESLREGRVHVAWWITCRASPARAFLQ